MNYPSQNILVLGARAKYKEQYPPPTFPLVRANMPNKELQICCNHVIAMARVGWTVAKIITAFLDNPLTRWRSIILSNRSRTRTKWRTTGVNTTGLWLMRSGMPWKLTGTSISLPWLRCLLEGLPPSTVGTHHMDLKVVKKSTCWVPMFFNSDQKKQRVFCSKAFKEKRSKSRGSSTYSLDLAPADFSCFHS